MTDTNDVLSLVVQSSSTILAILAGFLTIKAVGMSQEIRLSEKRMRLLSDEKKKLRYAKALASDQNKIDSISSREDELLKAIRKEQNYYKQLASPNDLRYGILLLAYFALFGIALPLLQKANCFSFPLALNLFFFFLGIAGLLAFIFCIIRSSLAPPGPRRVPRY